MKHVMNHLGISKNMKLRTNNLWRHLTSFLKAQLLKTHETGNMKHIVLILVFLLLSTAIPSGVGVGVLTGSRGVVSSSPPGSVLFLSYLFSPKLETGNM